MPPKKGKTNEDKPKAGKKEAKDDKKGKKESPIDKKNAKESPDRKGGKKELPDKKKSLPKTKEEIEAIVAATMARKRYENMDCVFKKESKDKSTVLILSSLHTMEKWNRLPIVKQFCNNFTVNINNNVEVMEPDVPIPLFQAAYLEGMVFTDVRKNKENEKLYVDISSRFCYFADDEVDPTQHKFKMKHVDYREYTRLYPISFEKDTPLSLFNQRLILKCRKERPGDDGFSFSIDLTMRPDSVIFNRPNKPKLKSGLFWKVRVFMSTSEKIENCDDRSVTMVFYKYTYAPIVGPEFPIRPSPSVSYERYKTLNDSGSLILTAKLEKDIFYQEEDIPVSVTIENYSSRTFVTAVVITVEQVVRIIKDILWEYSTIVSEVFMATEEFNLPIIQNKTWQKQVILPVLLKNSMHKYNVLIDGTMSTEEMFLAGSSIIIDPDPVWRSDEYKKFLMESLKPPTMPDESLDVDQNKSNENQNATKKEKKEKPASDKIIPPKPNSPKSKDKTSPIRTKETIMESVDHVIRNGIEYFMSSKNLYRPIFISYDVVVRLNLSTDGEDTVVGTPNVRIPFLLTRRTFVNKYSYDAYKYYPYTKDPNEGQ